MASIPAAAAPSTSSSSFEAPRSRLREAAALINRGGLGHAPSKSSPPSEVASLPSDINAALDLYAVQYLPNYPKSLAGIACRSFCLALALAWSLVLAAYLAFTGNSLWRAPFFVATLALFHFLEFYTTALANTHDAQVSSFLLMSNGPAYAIAHTTAFVECIVSHYFYPELIVPWPVHYLALAAGFVMLVVGQGLRAIAMIQAGQNFSHLVAHHKRSTHELVTNGVYAIFRHPSYFGFFWWGVGTQLVCGNTICLVVYAVALWRFFQTRIKGEEELLVSFFGDEYVEYRKRTVVGIPFVK